MTAAGARAPPPATVAKGGFGGAQIPKPGVQAGLGVGMWELGGDTNSPIVTPGRALPARKG